MSQGRIKNITENLNRMQSIWELTGERLRSQMIEVATCEYDERRILVEASFKDRRYQDTYVANGGRVPAGPVHDMTIRLLIDFQPDDRRCVRQDGRHSIGG